MRLPIARFAVALLVALAVGTALPRPARAQSLPVLTRLNSPSITLDAGTSKLLRVQLTQNGNPLPDSLITWQIVSTTAGATGPQSSVTDAAGITGARFSFPLPGLTRIRASYGLAGAPISVDYTVTSVTPPPPPPPPPTETRLTLQPAGATTLALVLGDRAGLTVVLRSSDGTPAAGVPVRFAIESSPGSPGVGRSDVTIVSGADGTATASFGFSTAGRVTIRASSAAPGFVFEPASILFTVDVASLGALTPERRTWQTAGEALDAICLDVFVDENGQPRPQPRPTPLCVYMTSTLATQGERVDAIHAFSATGLASQSTTALAGVEQQKASVQSRLSALRGGALRGAVDHLALTVDGVEISNDSLAAADRDGERFPVFSRRLDDAFARFYAGLDAGDAPATQPTAAPATAPRRERPWGFFVTGRLTRGNQSRGVEEDAFDFDTAGVTAGFDRAVSANGFLGLAVSGLRNQTDLTGGGGQLDADSWTVTLYGIREGEKGYVQATATYGQSRFDQRRRLPMPALGDLTARAEFDGDQLAGDLELGRSFDGRAGSLTAFVRGSWARASIDAFAEHGAVAELPDTGFGPVDFGLAVDAQELDSLLASGGLDWGKAISIRGGLVIPQLTATFSHEFSGDAQQVRARFLGDTAAAAAFWIFTDTPDRDWLTASAALRFQYLWGSFFVSYDHELMRDDLELRTVNAGLRFEF